VSKTTDYLINKQESGEMSEDEYSPEAEISQDFNAWKDALEADPEYLKKREAELDESLGKDRIF